MSNNEDRKIRDEEDPSPVVTDLDKSPDDRPNSPPNKKFLRRCVIVGSFVIVFSGILLGILAVTGMFGGSSRANNTTGSSSVAIDEGSASVSALFDSQEGDSSDIPTKSPDGSMDGSNGKEGDIVQTYHHPDSDKKLFAAGYGALEEEVNVHTTQKENDETPATYHNPGSDKNFYTSSASFGALEEEVTVEINQNEDDESVDPNLLAEQDKQLYTRTFGALENELSIEETSSANDSEDD